MQEQQFENFGACREVKYRARSLNAPAFGQVLPATSANPDFVLGGRTSASAECRH